MGLTLWFRNGETTSKNWGSLGGSGGVSAGSTGCFFFFWRMSFHRGIWTGGGGGTRGQSLTVVNITGWGWVWDSPDWRSFSDASAWREHSTNYSRTSITRTRITRIPHWLELNFPSLGKNFTEIYPSNSNSPPSRTFRVRVTGILLYWCFW